MFTGIIEAVGTVASAKMQGGDMRLRIVAPTLDWSGVKLGDSIATNGVCLTAIEVLQDGFSADVSTETLAHTTLELWQAGQRVNLEQAMSPSSRFGGHIVSGHVDGLGVVKERHPDARSERFTITAPGDLARYIAHKGSITVDGISLTVNRVAGADFELNIVPHTLAHTIMGDYRPGTHVNLEVDLIARYLERLLLGENAGEGNEAQHLTRDFLAQHGFLKP